MYQFNRNLKPTTSFLVICSCIMLASCAEQENEIEIPASAVQEQVMSVVKQKFPGIEITEVEIEGDPDLRYELSGMAAGKEIEIDITPNGKIIEIEQDEIDIPLQVVPEHIIAAVKKKFPDFELSEAEIEGSQTLRYEIEGKHAAKEVEIEIDIDGTIVEIEQEEDKDSSD